MAAAVGDLGRRVDVLVNNAGVGLHGDFGQQDVGANAAQIQLNCVTLVELTELFLPTTATGVRVLALCQGATETEFFARTGKEFVTSGRQTSEQVVNTAVAAIDKSTPTAISGWRNTLLANGYRSAPERVLLAVSEQFLKAH